MHFAPLEPTKSIVFTDPALLALHGIDVATGTSSLEIYKENAFTVSPLLDETKTRVAAWMVTRFLKKDTELPEGAFMRLSARHVAALQIKRCRKKHGFSLGPSTLPWLKGYIFAYKRHAPHSKEDFTFIVGRKLVERNLVQA